MAESAVLEVQPQLILKTPENVLARKRAWRKRNAQKLRAYRRARYHAGLDKARAEGRLAAHRRGERRRARNRVGPDELKLYQIDPLREERLKEIDFVVCRECGGKQVRLYHHVSKLHKLTLQEYQEKWNYPPSYALSFQEKSRRQQKEWGSLHEGHYFGGKRHELKPGEGTAARREKLPTAAMRRNWLRFGERLRGKPRLDLRGKKLLGQDRKNGTWVSDEPVHDAKIAELRLAGKRAREIAVEVALTPAAVDRRLKRLAFPSRACRFLYGEPVTKQDLLDLCNDFGLTKKSAIGLTKRSYHSVINHFSHLGPADVLSTQLADSFLKLRKTLIETCCFCEVGGKRVRHFLRSELRDLPELWERVRRGLIALRLWLRSNPASQPEDVLNWLCDQSRNEVAEEKTVGTPARVFRTLIFLWPTLKTLNEQRAGLLAGRRFIDQVVDEVLSMEYASAASRIAQVKRGDLTPLDPRTLGQMVREKQLAGKNSAEARRRGRKPTERHDVFVEARQLHDKLKAKYPVPKDSRSSWGAVARVLVLDESKKDPRGAADRLRLGVKHLQQT
jgi:ROS/MUCR transcriptional regulator protein